MKFTSLENDKSCINGFDKCSAHVDLPSYARVIGPCTFMEEPILQTINMPYGMETIGSQAFFGCANLSQVTIPDTVTRIESQAFIYCFSLQNINLPKNLIELGPEAFESCLNLERIVIPAGVKTIDINTFYACENLKEVILPNGLKTIACCAFGNCKSLQDIIIPPSVTTIDEDAFQDDRGLTIRGEAGSFAEQFAKSQKIRFISTSSEQTLAHCASEHTLSINPFFVLNLPCSADRHAIVLAAEEISFFSDTNLCAEAQASLLNPAKRLSAELDWFPGENKEKIRSIINCIQNKKTISSDGLSPLSALNSEIYNFSIADQEDIYEVGYAIVSIDSLYSDIDLNDLYGGLCNIRAEGNLPAISRNDFDHEFNAKRNTIRQVIKDKLSHFVWADYIKLATIIAKKYIVDSEYNGGVILSDFIDLYEVDIADEITFEAEDFMRVEGSIKYSVERRESVDIKQRIDFLIHQVTNWDKKVQPLQLRSMASGMPHKLSEEVGFAMRGLALYLNNELQETENALFLVQAMQPVFAEIKKLSDLFTKDISDLKAILISHKEMASIDKEIDAIKSYMVETKFNPHSTMISSLLSKVKSLSDKILKGELSDNEKQQVREGLCVTVRELAIELHNNKHETAGALQLTDGLINIFGDISNAREKLNVDASALRQQLRIKEAAEKQKRVKRIVSLVVVACVALLIWIGSNDGHATKQSVPEVRYSSSLESGTEVYVDIKSIFPAVGIYKEGYVNFTDFVCECKTSSGTTVWIYMSTTEYKNNFDSTASTSTQSTFAEEVKFSGTKRVHGTTQRADSVMYGLADDINAAMVINFSSLG